jgi:phosphopantothenoylcysteine synthetase/decarboxylase
LNIVVGVTGSIAAFKAAELVSRLKDANHNVYPILTAEGAKFISQLTFDALVKKRPQQPIAHIDQATLADIIVIAPATANTIGKLAGGLADNLLTTTVLAATCPVVIAPAMNTNMWHNPFVQANMAKLKQAGYHFVAAEEGALACGLTGKGRLAKIEKILAKIAALTEELLAKNANPSGECPRG